MPIYVYECPVGHQVEFLKLSKSDKEPTVCKKLTTKKQRCSGRYETFACGLPLEKVITGTNWRYTRGKNPLWPLTDPVSPDEPEK